MAKNQHNAGLHYRPLNQLGLSNFNDYIENPIDSRFKFNPPPLKCGKLFGLRKVDRQKEELQKLVQQAVQDREGYLKESIQMEKKVASDSLAYHVTRRKYEEGLMTSLDVQNNAATLLESQTGLLQSKLTYLMKCRLVDYYKGQDIIRTKE